MKKFLQRKIKYVFALALLLIAGTALGYTKPGNPTGFVNDYTGTLTAEQKQSLETKLSALKTQTGSEVAVVIIPDLGGDYIENYAVKLFKDWGIGRKDKDDGLLLLIALNDRQMRIEVGYGLEGVLTDLESSQIINNVLKPAFQKNDFYGGINEAVGIISAKIAGESVSIPETNKQSDFDWGNVIYFILIFFMFLSSVLSRSKSWWAGGVVGGIIALLITLFKGLLWIGLISFIFLIPLGLLFDYLVSKAYTRGRATGVYPWWIGGGRSGGSSGGGFGGFGGGGSGGGGSSGSW